MLATSIATRAPAPPSTTSVCNGRRKKQIDDVAPDAAEDRLVRGARWPHSERQAPIRKRHCTRDLAEHRASDELGLRLSVDVIAVAHLRSRCTPRRVAPVPRQDLFVRVAASPSLNFSHLNRAPAAHDSASQGSWMRIVETSVGMPVGREGAIIDVDKPVAIVLTDAALVAESGP